MSFILDKKKGPGGPLTWVFEKEDQLTSCQTRAVLLLNVQYMALFEQTFGLRFTVFEVPPAVFATAIFAIASAIFARQDKNQPFITQ